MGQLQGQMRGLLPYTFRTLLLVSIFIFTFSPLFFDCGVSITSVSSLNYHTKQKKKKNFSTNRIMLKSTLDIKIISLDYPREVLII